MIGDSEATAVRLEKAITWARSSWEFRDVLARPAVMYLDPDVVMTAAPDVKGGNKRKEALARIGHGFGHDLTIPLGPPTNLGVMGHSWGARAAARVAVRGKVDVKSIASIAGSWDEDASIQALVGARDPTLMMVGTDDFLNSGSLQGLWKNLAIPKHQAMLQNIGHLV